MDKEFINKINEILNKTEIDDRVKPLVKLYFLGKLKLGELTKEEIENQIDILCSRIPNVEFSTSKIVSAYSGKSGVLTVNKQLILEGKSDEVILPVFMKFESALNQHNRREWANHIEDFIKASKIATLSNIPISDRLYKLYEIAKYCYGDIEYKTDELKENGPWEATCSKYNTTLNKMIITGEDEIEGLLEGLRIFNYEVFDAEAFENENFKGKYKNKEYQEKAAKILSYIENIDIDKKGKKLIQNIQLFTGCTQEMIEKVPKITYMGDIRINHVLETTLKENMPPISQNIIVSKVQEVIDKKTEWDNRVKHLIIPFFIRSQKIYNWDIDEFQERLNQVDLKIDKISFEDLNSDVIMGNTSNNAIELNSKIFLDKNGELKWPVDKTIFHELGHITDENVREDVYSKERLQNSSVDQGRFYEWTNTIFEKIVLGDRFYKKNDAMELTQSGYGPLAPMGCMLSCALGMSEMEFAKIKDKGREYEENLWQKNFYKHDDNDNLHGADVLEKIKSIFDEYKIKVNLSLKDKILNQKLLNEAYEECLKIMQKRIGNELENNEITNLEDYKKHQMFFLRKMNFNFKSASKSSGFIFKKTPTIHNIGFCDDNLTKKELEKIANEQISMIDFGFNSNTLDKYNKAMIQFNQTKNIFNKYINVPFNTTCYSKDCTKTSKKTKTTSHDEQIK